MSRKYLVEQYGISSIPLKQVYYNEIKLYELQLVY